MGQYFSAVTISRDGRDLVIYSMQSEYFRKTQDFNYYTGLKLTEHSWIGVEFTDFFSHTIYHKPVRVAWLGDYAELDDYLQSSYMRKKGGEEAVVAFCERLKNTKETDFVPFDKKHFNYRNKFLVNHTKRVAFSLTPYAYSSRKYKMYPVSLLTAVGNGKGGGDYFSWTNRDKIGIWAFDVLSIEDEIPDGYDRIDGYTFDDENF